MPAKITFQFPRAEILGFALHPHTSNLQRDTAFQFPRAEILGFAMPSFNTKHCLLPFQFPRAEILGFAIIAHHDAIRRARVSVSSCGNFRFCALDALQELAGDEFQFPRAEILGFANLIKSPSPSD